MILTSCIICTSIFKFWKYWPDDGLFRPKLVANIWNNKKKIYLWQAENISYFILILYFKQFGMFSTKIKCSLFDSSDNLMVSIKIRLVLLSHLSFVLQIFFIFPSQLCMRFYSPPRVPYSLPIEFHYPNNIWWANSEVIYCVLLWS
jgi:hypothetical protein